MRFISPNEIHVKAPPGVPEAVVFRFIQEHKAWIANRTQTLASKEDALLRAREDMHGRCLYMGVTMPFTFAVDLDRNNVKGVAEHISDTSGERFHCHISKRFAAVNRPEDLATEVLWNYLAENLRTVIQRCTQHPDINRRKLDGFTIRAMRTKWGSCSDNGKIRINLYLACLPMHIAEMIVYHELAHLDVHGHGPKFYDRLGHLCPKFRRIEKELRQLEKDFVIERAAAIVPTKYNEPVLNPRPAPVATDEARQTSLFVQ